MDYTVFRRKIIMVDTAIVQEEFQKDMENVQLTLEFRN